MPDRHAKHRTHLRCGRPTNRAAHRVSPPRSNRPTPVAISIAAPSVPGNNQPDISANANAAHRACWTAQPLMSSSAASTLPPSTGA